MSLDIPALAEELNERAMERPFGSFQEIRKQVRSLAKRPTRSIFQGKTIADHWACHYGGRSELQFNIGTYTENGDEYLRFGVAFSLEPSQSLPDISKLLTSVRRFNDYLRANPDEFADLRMWHHDEHRSPSYSPSQIPDERFRAGTFIFMGARCREDEVDPDRILDLFERLLPLYVFVESRDAVGVTSTKRSTWSFKPGCAVKPVRTNATQSQRTLDVSLIHNELQQALFDQLVGEFGEGNVGTESATATGSVDVVVRQPDGDYSFFEIKTATTARGCVREAIGQLLEYAFWPGGPAVARLVVVGEPEQDEECWEYLRTLRDRFALPLEYLRVAR